MPVYVTKGSGSGSVTLQATSESDPTKSVSASCSEGNVGGTVPATLSLVARHAGDLRPVHAGRRARLHGHHVGQRDLDGR